MKSLIKKLAAVIIAAATMLGLAGLGAVTATAADTDVTPSWANGTGSITVNTAEGFATDGKGNALALSYYQMFTAEAKAETGVNDGTKTDVTYTLNSDWTAFFTSADNVNTPGTNFVEYTKKDGTKVTVSDQAAAYIRGLSEAQRADFANLAQKWASTNIKNTDAAKKFGTVTPTADKDGAFKTVTISNLPLGYYIVAPADDQKGNGGATAKYQALLVNLTDTDNNVSIQLKHEFPTVDKTVDNKHASENKIGDTVNYTLTSKVPDMHEYTLGYTFNFLDTLSKGLDLVPNAADEKVTNIKDFAPVVTILDGTDAKKNKVLEKGKDKDYTVTAEKKDDGTTSITIEMNDNFRANHQVDAGKTITVTYSAKLNKDAVIGKDGNTNEAKVEYSNDPSNNGTGTSIPSEVKSHTFGFTIDKYTGKDYSEFSERLGGAEFKVYADNGGKAGTVLKFNITDKGDGTKQAVAQYAGDDHQNDAADADGNPTDTLTTPKYGRIRIGGLKTGTYWVEETKAPEGYNKLGELIKVEISAKYDTDNEALDGLTTNGGTGKLKSWNVVYSYSNENHTIQGEPPVLPVENVNKGNHPVLPSTGGMGTILFSVFGVLIVALGTAWYVKSNRKSTK